MTRAFLERRPPHASTVGGETTSLPAGSSNSVTRRAGAAAAERVEALLVQHVQHTNPVQLPAGGQLCASLWTQQGKRPSSSSTCNSHHHHNASSSANHGRQAQAGAMPFRIPWLGSWHCSHSWKASHMHKRLSKVVTKQSSLEFRVARPGET